MHRDFERKCAVLSLILVGVCILLGLAYRFYGGWMENHLDVMEERRTPAHTLRDGVDYEPTPTPIVFGHHFSSIAGAGPIVGPISAALLFGWGPALIWIVLGVIFIGSVQDFTSLVASLRNKGQGLAQIGRRFMSPLTYRLFLVFLILTLEYIIIVFLDMTASTFAPITVAWGEVNGAPALTGGTVATASVLTIFIAAVFGQLWHRFHLSLGKTTLMMVPLVFLGLVVGHFFPLAPSFIPACFGSDKYFWSIILLFYCLWASVLPVWTLLQPRDYLSSFLLYACLIGGLIGLGLSGFNGSGVVSWPAFKAWSTPSDGSLYPALFVMIACGAVSGFHALVASGTTSKQLTNERAARPVGMGGMLVEAVLATLALASVMILSPAAVPQHSAPPAMFASGMEHFFIPFGIPEGWVMSFVLLAVSTFLLTTLDSCTRLGRLLFQELTGLPSKTALQRVGTTLLLLLPVLLVFREVSTPAGPIPMWKAIWPAFGATNQLLAALALLMIYSWMRGQGKRALFILIPMVFMFITTMYALVQLARLNFQHGNWVLSVLSIVLMALALEVAVDVTRHLFRASKNRRLNGVAANVFPKA